MNIFLALESKAALEVIEVAKRQKEDIAVWTGSDSINAEEFKFFIHEGINITRFAYPLACASAEVIDDAVSTIAEHHPNQTIWVQRT